jgi:hypothetical protein
MVPEVAEMVPEDSIEYLQLHDEKGNPLDEWLHFDPVTQKPIKGPKPKKPKMIPTGSMKQVDLVCHDCGRQLVGGGRVGGKYPFDYLVCGRLDSRDPQFIHIRRPAPPSKLGKLIGAKGRGMVAVTEKVEGAPEPGPNTVVECGRYGLEDE